MKSTDKRYLITILIFSLLMIFNFTFPKIFYSSEVTFNGESLDSEINKTLKSSVASDWQEDGVPVCTELETQSSVVLCSDEEGGTILAWEDSRVSGPGIYAQKLNSTGNFLWGPNGTAICTADEYQGRIQVCNDGAGGAIITWQDQRDEGSPYGDIYAQRINSTGDVQWDINGVPICTEIDTQYYPRIISNNMGGAIITWQDRRDGNYDIYAQRIDSSGNSLWSANGTAICTEAGSQDTAYMCSDAAGGAIIAWSDERIWSNYEVYAQRINSTGDVQWGTNGTLITTETNDQIFKGISVDGTGGTFLAIEDDGDFYVKRINSTGGLEWGGNWTPICTDSGSNQDFKISSDNNRGAIMVWSDAKLGYNAYNIYAQMVNSTGDIQWEINGKLICNAIRDQRGPEVCHDGNGGAIITWNDERNDPTESDIFDIYYQVITKEGKSLLEANGSAVCLAIDRQYNPKIISDGEGGAFIAWQDQRNAVITETDIYMQHLNGFDIPICVSHASDPFEIQICSDENNGAIIAWRGDTSGLGRTIFAQRIDYEGKLMWSKNGVALATGSNHKDYLQICSDGNGGAIVTWEDYRSGEGDIYAQRIDASGNIKWLINGLGISNYTNIQKRPQICSDGSGGAIIAWWDNRTGNWDIYAQRVNADGTMLWMLNGTEISTEDDMQIEISIVSDMNHGAIITWSDYRYGGEDVFGQRIDATGNTLWTPNGTGICTYTGSQILPHTISDGTGGAIITWRDRRNFNYDIYGQRINSTGDFQWNPDGIPVCIKPDTQIPTKICTDGNEGAIVIWGEDTGVPTGEDVFAQRINATGDNVWDSNGNIICNASGDQMFPDICEDGNGGAIITWQDSRGLNNDIYAQRVDSEGIIQWKENGIALCTAMDDQRTPHIVSNGDGGAILAWQDERYLISNDDIYAGIIYNKKPSSSNPGDIITSEIGDETIDWVLHDDDGKGGQYQVIAENILGHYYTWIDWTPWTSDNSIIIPINRSATGTFNYTIRYSDDQNKSGIEDTVIVSIKPIPGDILLSSDAGIPDDDGIFTLTWNESHSSKNFTIYEYHSYISEINGSLISLLEGTTSLSLPRSGYIDGTYYFIVVAYNDYGNKSSNCLRVDVLFPNPPGPLTLSAIDTIPNDGNFTLVWDVSDRADNYSVYEHSSYITGINGSLTILATEISILSLHLGDYTNGTYYFIIEAKNINGTTLSNCLTIVISIPPPGPPGSFTLSSNAGTPDNDGNFTLVWEGSNQANNYSVYEYSSFITEINGSLTLLEGDLNILTHSLSSYADGTYYFIIVAHNDYGDTLSNCIEIIVQIPPPNGSTNPVIPGYNVLYFIVALSLGIYFILKKRLKRIK